MMPVDCQHGVTIDWGDFGPCQDCNDHPGESCPSLVDCPECARSAPWPPPPPPKAVTRWCGTHNQPMADNAEHCRDYRKAEPDGDGWWSIDRSPCADMWLFDALPTPTPEDS